MPTFRGLTNYLDGTPGATDRLVFETLGNLPRGVAPANLPVTAANASLAAIPGLNADNVQAGLAEMNARESGFTPVVVTTSGTLIGADQDGQNIILTHSLGAVSVEIGNAVENSQAGAITKQTAQNVTVTMEASAVYLLPDGSTTSAASFTLHGIMTWIVIRKDGSTDPVLVISGDVSIPQVARNVRNRKLTLSGAQTLNAATAQSNDTLILITAAATWTLASRLAATQTGVTEHLTIRNRSGGDLTIAAGGLTIVGDTGPIPTGKSASLEWEHDGTTERVWIEISA